MNNFSLYEIKDNLGFLEKKVLFLTQKRVKPREVLLEINKEKKKYAYTTIMTIMERLYKKRYLRRKKIGKAFFYWPTTPVNKLKEKSSIYLVRKLLSFFSFFTIIRHLFFISLVCPLIGFFHWPLVKGTLSGSLTIFTLFVLSNSLINLHLNGFWEYLLLIIKEPRFFVSHLSVNFNYLNETLLSSIIILLFLFFSFKLIFKISNKNYQFKIF